MTDIWSAVVVGCAVVVAGCILGAASVQIGRLTRNWLYFTQTAGAALLVAGVVGQRHFPSDQAIHRVGEAQARAAGPGLWEAGVIFPGIGFGLTPLAVIGLVVLAAGAALLLFFEGPRATTGLPNDVLRPFDADDAG